MFAKVLGQGFEQFGMAGLDGPRRGRRFRGVLAGHIKSKRRVHDANSHQFGPDQIHGCPRKLWVICEYPRESVSPWLARSGALPTEQEFRLGFDFVTRHAPDASAIEIVSLALLQEGHFLSDTVGTINP